MNSYCIGIDTGGTYTDAVLLDTGTKEIVNQTKVRTTHHDLSIGVAEALTQLLHSDLPAHAITLVSVSTTLATNAMAENQGAKVALLVFGHVRHFKLPIVASIFLKGGHTIIGKEDQPLDLEGLIDSVQGLKEEVDSYAVCGAMSIKNPAHELVAERAINLIDPKPVFLSHKVSSHPGMLERSATACMHAKLQPIMAEFLSSVRNSMETLSLTCPAVIICGDGTAASFDDTLERSATTMASGPAATARFGAHSNQEKALVIDVGGTTTDVCLIQDGKSMLNKRGCRIGRWQTHVTAVDMYTAAGGGDSHVSCDRYGLVHLRATRVKPLALTENLPSIDERLNLTTDTCFVFPEQDCKQEKQADSVLAYLYKNGPSTPGEIAKGTGLQGIALEKKLERLAFEQRLFLAGFTPTDALHVLDQLAIGDRDASIAGADRLARLAGLSRNTLCRKILEVTSETIERALLTYVARRSWSAEQAEIVMNRRRNDLFSVRFSLHLPLIGIGAAAPYFLPAIARRLDTTVTFPEHYEIGNAIGAALIGLEKQAMS